MTTTLAVDKVLAQLRREFRYVQIKNAGAWVCCPFHGERAPSLKFNMDPTSKFGVGSWYCFGCAKSGSWFKFTQEYSKGNPKSQLERLMKSDNEIHEVVGSRNKLRKLNSNLKGLTLDSLCDEFGAGMSVEINSDWRDIPKKVLTKAGARLIADRQGTTSVLLPCWVHGELVGGVKARIVPYETKKFSNYMNSSGEWVKNRGLYPFDTAVDRMRVWHTKTLVLGEGPRDSLNLLANGIPAMSILGINNWSAAKRDLVLSADPDQIILCMDGDRAGVSATNKLMDDFENFCDVDYIDTMKISKKLGRKVDGGNAPKSLINKLISMVYES
jgi:5S rRNA maturation endonuclease (ribonuclease M5)